jgi:hypothetical protein
LQECIAQWGNQRAVLADQPGLFLQLTPVQKDGWFLAVAKALLTTLAAQPLVLVGGSAFEAV